MKYVLFVTGLVLVFLLSSVFKEKRITIVDYRGCLGNQFFQTAAIYSYARDHGYDFYLNKNFMNSDLFHEKTYMKNVFFRLKCKDFSDSKFKIYTQIPQSIHIPRFKKKDNLCFVGFFESEKFFKRYKSEILDLFAPSETILNYLKEKYSPILENDKTVAIHIRTLYTEWIKNWVQEKKGSQKNFETYFHFWTPPDMDFIKKGIESFPEDYTFVIFSDHIPYCKIILSSIERRFIFIENETDYVDFYLMSLCKNQIIPNSTFSWWAAYLNPNPKKVVIVRSPWNSSYQKPEDVIPPEWKKIAGNPNVPLPDPVYYQVQSESKNL